jgi:hypothetical protein
MFYPTESKPQTWRALAVLVDGGERLIYLGRSTTQVRAGYKGAFLELFDDEDVRQVETISLQCWDGAPDRGRWVAKGTLSIPDRNKLAALVGAAGRTVKPLSLRESLSESDDAPPPSILAFRPASAEGDTEEDDFEERPRRLAADG